MKKLQQNIINCYGEEGKKWLATLPDLIEKLAIKWGLSGLSPVANCSYHYVMTGDRLPDHFPIILKLGIDKEALKREYEVLKFYQGRGCCKVLDADFKNKAMLLERFIPGVSLKNFFPRADRQAVMYAANVIKHLHSMQLEYAYSFSTVHDWLQSLYKENELIPKEMLHKARELSDQLVKTKLNLVLLHGDLHHDNILSNGKDGYRAIDPKGVIGEAAYEVGAFIRNPMPELLAQPNPVQIIRQRLDLFSDFLNLNKRRLQDWSYVQAVLAACWAIEDGGDEKPFLQVAAIIEAA
jgi:streptomycin 6-kinase